MSEISGETLMSVRTQRELSVLLQASRVLDCAQTIDEIKAVRDKAEAARAYVKAAKLGLEVQNRAAELKLQAERKAGKLLKSLRLRGGDRKSKRQSGLSKLAELGISRDQSKRWQYIASVPDEEFSQYIALALREGREITSAGLIRVARRARDLRIVNGHAKSGAASNNPAQSPHAVDALDELLNHSRLLGDILQPFYEDDGIVLKRAERRLIARLVRDITQLVMQLRKTMAYTPDFLNRR